MFVPAVFALGQANTAAGLLGVVEPSCGQLDSALRHQTLMPFRHPLAERGRVDEVHDGTLRAFLQAGRQLAGHGCHCTVGFGERQDLVQILIVIC